MAARHLDRALEGLARRQHCVFNRRQALRIGFTRGMIDRRVASGAWTRLAGEVFALPAYPGTWQQRCMAATLSVPAAAVADRAAAVLHRATGFRPGPIDLVTRQGTTHRSPFATVHETRTVGRLSVVEGIRVVSRPDLTVRLARLLPIERLDRLVREFTGRDRRYLPELRDRVVGLSGSRLVGLPHLRAVLADIDDDETPPESDLEAALRALTASVSGIGTVVWQAPLRFWPRGAARCDGLAVEWPLILEADGRTWHTRVEDFERDRERDNLANVHGYDVLRFTYNQLMHRLGDCRRALNTYVALRRSGSCARFPYTSADTLRSAG